MVVATSILAMVDERDRQSADQRRFSLHAGPPERHVNIVVHPTAGWCATFIKEHVAVEDEVIYKALEQHTPGCTNAYAAELELHMPLLLQSVDAVK
eukprot:4131938-Amphidinium_carterae.2